MHSFILRLTRTEEEKHRRHLHGDRGATFSKGKQLTPCPPLYSNTITTITKDNLLMCIFNPNQETVDETQLTPPEEVADQPDTPPILVRGDDDKLYRLRIRKLTPRECFRLMGVDDADIDKIQTAGISKSQQYKMAGNSIVVHVLHQIFKNLFVETTPPPNTQTQLF